MAKKLYHGEGFALAGWSIATNVLDMLIAKGIVTRQEAVTMLQNAAALHLQSPAGQMQENVEAGALIDELCERYRNTE